MFSAKNILNEASNAKSPERPKQPNHYATFGNKLVEDFDGNLISLSEAWQKVSANTRITNNQEMASYFWNIYKGLINAKIEEEKVKADVKTEVKPKQQ